MKRAGNAHDPHPQNLDTVEHGPFRMVVEMNNSKLVSVGSVNCGTRAGVGIFLTDEYAALTPEAARIIAGQLLQWARHAELWDHKLIEEQINCGWTLKSGAPIPTSNPLEEKL